MGTTVKIQSAALVPAQGLRIGIYPQVNVRDRPRRDNTLNLVRLPLPYDAAFMELYYKAFNLVRAFLRADAQVPPPVNLPDAEDRYVAQELEVRRHFPVLDVADAIRGMSQPDLLETLEITSVQPTAALSEQLGLEDAIPPEETSESVSVTPEPMTD